MTAIDSAGAFVPIFPSTKPNTHLSGRRQNGYRKIRWKKYDPGKKSPSSSADQFVQWQPPDSNQDAARDDLRQRKPKKLEDPPPSKAMVVVSPVQPLPCSGTRVDPFLALPIKATETVQDTMDYFVTICKGVNAENMTVRGPINPHLSLLLPFALQNGILFEAMIAVCRASILLSLGRPIWDDQAFVHHRGSTITALNSRLKTKDATDDASLLTVTMLMTLEYLSENQAGVLMHCKGLEKMIELRGPMPEGEDESDWTKFVKLGLTAYKALGSFVTGQPPEIPRHSIGYLTETFQELQLDQPLSYPETPFSPDLCIVLSRLSSGFSELCLKSQVSVQMINLIASISAASTLMNTETNYHSLLDGTWDLESHDQGLLTPPDDENRQHIMIQTILSSLQRMALTTTQPIESLLTSGLLGYLFQLRGLTPVNLFYDPILRKFITTLPFHTRPAAVHEQTCLIWCSIAIAGTLALRTVPMPESHTVMDHALDLYPEARSWPRLERILRSYFWTDTIGAHWKRVWQNAMDRRQFLLRRSQRTEIDASEIVTDEAELEPPDMQSEALREHIRQHMSGAPRSMMELTQAMGLCPFRPRSAASSPYTVATINSMTPHSTPQTGSSPSSTIS